MSLDHGPIPDPRGAKNAVVLRRAADPRDAMDHSHDGSACPVQAASLQRCSLFSEGRMLAAPTDALTEAERIGSTKQALPCHGRGTRTSNRWNPPATRAQHMRQQAVAIVLAFVLAALLGQIRF